MIAVRLNKTLEEKLTKLAQSTHRTKSFYVQQALEQFLEDEELVIKALELRDNVAQGKEKIYNHEEAWNFLDK